MTHRHHSECCVDYTCSNGGINGLLNSSFIKDKGGEVEDLQQVQKTNIRVPFHDYRHIVPVFLHLHTHCVDARKLLRELQDEGDDKRLAVEVRAEQLRDGHLLLPHHLPALFLHLLHVSAHI